MKLFKKLDRKDVIIRKKIAIRKLNNLLESFLSSGDEDDLKESNLLSYWIETYCRFLIKERTFVPFKNKKYCRGEIIQADLGFRIGNEEGGLHYGIVIDKDNAQSSGIVTIIPLSSKKPGTKPNKYTIDLGSEIYDKLYAKYMDKFSNSLTSFNSELDESSGEKKIVLSIEFDTTEADKIMDELNLIKKGTIALVSQITTISKIRISKPLKTSDPFSGIKLSDESLSLIDKKICELYLGKNV